MQRVLDIISCDVDAKDKGQIMYLIVIASPPKPSNFELCRYIGRMIKRVLGNISTKKN